MENKKLEFKVENSILHIGVDPNQDGQKVLTAKLHLSEAIQEAFKKGVPVEGAKVVSFEFKLTKLVLMIDTDQDGEPLLELEIDLAEVVDEIGLMKN